jgi:hypothetical protein
MDEEVQVESEDDDVVVRRIFQHPTKSDRRCVPDGDSVKRSSLLEQRCACLARNSFHLLAVNPLCALRTPIRRRCQDSLFEAGSIADTVHCERIGARPRVGLAEGTTMKRQVL